MPDEGGGRILLFAEKGVNGCEGQIVDVECGKLIFRFRSLGEHSDVWTETFEPVSGFLPEAEDDISGNIDTVPVNIKFADEEFHIAPEMLPESGIFKVQYRKRPLSGIEGAVGVAADPVGMFFQKECAGPAMVVGKIKHDAQPETVRFRNEFAEVVFRSVFGVDAEIICCAVRVARIFRPAGLLAFAPVLAIHVAVGFVNRHEVDDGSST